MPTDGVFFFKLPVPKGASDLPWPNPTILRAIDPPAGMMCGGGDPSKDPRCSTAYTNLWASLRDAEGRVLPSFLRRYAPEVDGRVAFVGHSAPHGFLDPFATNDADRRQTSAYILLDATFGGGKDGYKAFATDAVAGERLLVTSTANTGGDDGWQLVWNDVLARTGASPKAIAARPPMPEPSGGVTELGKLLFWYRFVDAKNQSELPHWHHHELALPMLEAYLVPYWRGELGSSWMKPLAIAVAAGGVAAAGWWLGQRRRRRSA